jgi:Mor family transcriptional regulator
MGLTGVWVKRFSLQQFVKQFLVAIGLRRDGTPLPRNKLIQMRYDAGEGLSDLARAFGLSPQRVYQVVHCKRN